MDSFGWYTHFFDFLFTEIKSLSSYFIIWLPIFYAQFWHLTRKIEELNEALKECEFVHRNKIQAWKNTLGLFFTLIAICQNSSDYLFLVSQSNKNIMAQNKAENKNRHIVSCTIIPHLLSLSLKYGKKLKE